MALWLNSLSDSNNAKGLPLATYAVKSWRLPETDLSSWVHYLFLETRDGSDLNKEAINSPPPLFRNTEQVIIESGEVITSLKTSTKRQQEMSIRISPLVNGRHILHSLPLLPHFWSCRTNTWCGRSQKTGGDFYNKNNQYLTPNLRIFYYIYSSDCSPRLLSSPRSLGTSSMYPPQAPVPPSRR